MKSELTASSPKVSNRGGFTLIEVLIVITIIGILATISTSVIGRMLTLAKIRATQTTIMKINAVLQQRAKSIARTPLAQSINVSLSNNSSSNIQKYKDEYRRWFPQVPNESESLDPAKYNLPGEVLYAMVAKGAVIGSDEVQGAEFTDREVVDTDNDGISEIVDGWGQPLLFYRWPTRLIRPGGGNNPVNPDNLLSMFMTNLPDTNTLNSDPDNPLSLSMNFRDPGTGSAMSSSNIEIKYHTMFRTPPGSNTSDMKATYHTLLIVSGGPDLDTGLIQLVDTNGNGTFETTEIDAYYAAFGHLAQPAVSSDYLNSAMNDNLTNLNIEVK